jgi:superfamily II DNA or RNA helicase
MIIINKLNESFVNLQGDYDELLTLKEHLTFKVPNAKFMPKVKAGIWSGDISLLERNGNLPIGLYPKVKELCKQLNIPFESNFTKTSINITEDNINSFVKEIKCNLTCRDYQIKAIIASFKQQKNIVISPTASGKSMILFLIAMLNLKINPSAKILLIVPSINLVDQMKGDFLEYGENTKLPEIHTIYSGQERHNEYPITISTWQSLQMIQDKEFFEDFDVVLVDEVHGASNSTGQKSMSMVVQKLIQACSNAKMKVGVSGTIQDEKINRLQLEGLFGKINQFTNTKELMDKGTLSKLEINFLVLNYEDKIRKQCYNLPYPDEMKLITEIEQRRKFIINLAKKIKGKNVLILFRNIEFGKMIYNDLLELELDRNIHYVSGETKGKDREETRQTSIEDTDGIIVASIGVFATGVNIPNLDYLIFAQSQKSKIKVLQSIGRVIRKSKSKNKATVIDLVDNLSWKRKQNFSLKHGMERMELYDKEQFEYDIKEINIK